MTVTIAVVNRLSKRIMRGCLLASPAPAKADTPSGWVCVSLMCVAGCGPSGVLGLPATVDL